MASASEGAGRRVRYGPCFGGMAGMAGMARVLSRAEDPALRAAFDAESRAIGARVGEMICWLVIAILPAFAILDRWIAPAHAPVILGFRLGCVAILLAVLRLFRMGWGKRHPYALVIAIATIVGLTIDVIAYFTGGGASPRASGLHLVLVGGGLLVPWGPAWSALAGVVLVGGFAGSMLATGHVGNVPVFVSNVAFLSGTAIVGVVATAFRERLRWREFMHRDALAQALRQRSEFLAKMSHELRTPLHVLIGYADIMLEDLIPPDAAELRRLTDHVRSQGVLLHRLVSDLLDYSKVQAGKMEVQQQPVHVAELVTQIAESFRPLLARRGLGLEVLGAPDLPLVQTDRRRLEQIVLNLVGNAIKFTEAGGVVVEARTIRPGDAELDGLAVLDDTPDGDAPRPGSGVAVLVRDTGIGIQPDDLRRLAIDFEQVDGTATRFGGTGLGLSICKRFARLLGGCIAVASTPGRGSVFALLLPAPIEPVRAAA